MRYIESGYQKLSQIETISIKNQVVVVAVKAVTSKEPIIKPIETRKI